MKCTLDTIYDDVKDIYKLNILSAMKALQGVWMDLQKSAIRNCWIHTNLISVYSALVACPDTILDVEMNREILQAKMDAIVLVCARMDIQHLSNVDGEDDIFEADDDAKLLQDFLQQNNHQEQSDEEEQEFPLPSLARQLQAIALDKRIVENRADTDSAALRTINRG